MFDVPENVDTLDIVEIVLTRLCFGGGVHEEGSSTDILSKEFIDIFTELPLVESHDVQDVFLHLLFFFLGTMNEKHPM